MDDQPYPIPRPLNARRRLANRLELMLRREAPEEQKRAMREIALKFSEKSLLTKDPDQSSPERFCRDLITDNPDLNLEHLDFQRAMRSEVPEELAEELIPPDGHLETWDDRPPWNENPSPLPAKTLQK